MIDFTFRIKHLACHMQIKDRVLFLFFDHFHSLFSLAVEQRKHGIAYMRRDSVNLQGLISLNLLMSLHA